MSEGLAFSLNVHEIVAEQQQLHGLRPDNDYKAYRQYITRRLERIRHGAGFKFGKGRAFVARPLTAADVRSNRGLFLLPLLEAERAWSYAMEIKQDLEVAKGGRGTLTSHLQGRLRKAAAHAAAFEALATSLPADERTCLEATAYSSWMAGQVTFR